MPPVRDAEVVLGLLRSAAEAARSTFERCLADGSPGGMRRAGRRPGQYAFDLVVDDAVLGILDGAGMGVLSEESGLTGHGDDSGLVVVVDPVDGSTNASRGIPWYACSLCVVDPDGPWVSVVMNLATGTLYEAVRGAGATRDGAAIAVADTARLSDALVVLNGHTPTHFGWRQFRALGATALDICAVADGSVDATIDCTHDALGPWDYMGAMLVLTEAGGLVVDAQGRELATLDHSARRTPVSACNPGLLEQALAARGER